MSDDMLQFGRIGHDSPPFRSVDEFVHNLQAARVFKAPVVTVAKAVDPFRVHGRTESVEGNFVSDPAVNEIAWNVRE